MDIRFAGAISALVVSLGMTAATSAQDAAALDTSEPVVATIAGYSAGGMASLLGEGQALTVRKHYPGSNIVYEPGNPAGSMVAVANGEREFALETSIEIGMAQRGEAPFREAYGDKISGIVAIGPKLTTAHVYGRAAFLDEHDIKSFADIKERKIPVRISINQPGNLWARAHVVAILNQYGLTMEELESFGGTLIPQSTGPTHELMKDSRADIIITGGFAPVGSVIELNSTTPLRFLPMTAEEAAAAAKQMNVDVGVIPAGTYDFQTEDLHVPVSTHYIVAGPAATDEQAYKFAKSVNAELADFQAMHPAFQAATKETLVPKVEGLRIHPGAAAFYKEAGLLPN
ncbi:TAXI family TRAP transporter solute-binding subunit [Aquibium sp. LZ166]|uniref:TAXI family TRAP transporter solute-binding subunit n=1 Tax=Aquibium pacificus TaxID=3153579 RepID=A0ABV3SG50_9HYPH